MRPCVDPAATQLGGAPQLLMPPTPQASPGAHVLGHRTDCPQLSVAGPQAFPAQVTSGGWATHPHLLAVAPPPPQTRPLPGHESLQVKGTPQVSVAGPQSLPVHGVRRSGAHAHALGVPWQVSLVVHDAQLAAWQPLFRSVGTQKLPHGFVPAPQAPIAQVVPWQTSVPLPASGHAARSHVVAPQPYVGSVIATHFPAHGL